jgi:phage terminase small subunit
MQDTLNFRQERFVLEYLKDQNASAAAARAGYTAKNMAQQGSELLNNPAIRERVRAEMQAMLAEIRCSAFALMKQRMRAAFFDAGKLFGSGWDPLDPGELDGETRAAVEVTTVMRKSGPVVRMKQPDRDRALRALEKVHERLDRLNEQHWAKLAREGKVKTLEEIEAMDAGEAQQAQTALAGPASTAPLAAPHAKAPLPAALAALFSAGPAPQKPQKPQVFSGSGFTRMAVQAPLHCLAEAA